MYGLFVDNSHRLIIIPREPSEAKNLFAYGAAQEEDDFEGIIELKDDNFSLNGVSGKIVDDDIVWENGKTWHRLQISPYQAYMLTRRPYFPLSLFAATLAVDMFQWTYSKTKQVKAKLI